MSTPPPVCYAGKPIVKSNMAKENPQAASRESRAPRGNRENGQASLTCKVTWSLGRPALQRLTTRGNAARFLRLDLMGEQTAQVTVTPSWRRIDFEGDTMFGGAGSLVDDGDTIIFVDHKARSRLSIERKNVPFRFESP